MVNEVRSYQLGRRAGRPTLAAARHRAQALVAEAGMRADPMLRAIETRARGLRAPSPAPVPSSPPESPLFPLRVRRPPTE